MKSHFFFFQAEDGIRDLVRSRGLGDVYKRQELIDFVPSVEAESHEEASASIPTGDALLVLSLIHI